MRLWSYLGLLTSENVLFTKLDGVEFLIPEVCHSGGCFVMQSPQFDVGLVAKTKEGSFAHVLYTKKMCSDGLILCTACEKKGRLHERMLDMKADCSKQTTAEVNAIPRPSAAAPPCIHQEVITYYIKSDLRIPAAGDVEAEPYYVHHGLDGFRQRQQELQSMPLFVNPLGQQAAVEKSKRKRDSLEISSPGRPGRRVTALVAVGVSAPETIAAGNVNDSTTGILGASDFV